MPLGFELVTGLQVQDIRLRLTALMMDVLLDGCKHLSAYAN